MSFGHPYAPKIEGYIHDGWLILHDKNNLFNIKEKIERRLP
jgi:hypothetical protein